MEKHLCSTGFIGSCTAEFDASKPTVHKLIRELEEKGMVVVGSERKSNYCKLMREEMEYV